MKKQAPGDTVGDKPRPLTQQKILIIRFLNSIFWGSFTLRLIQAV